MYTSWDINLFRMYFRFNVAIFEFHWRLFRPLFPLVSVLLEPDNMGVAMGIDFRRYHHEYEVRHVFFSYVLPVICDTIRIGEYPHLFLRIFWHQKLGIAVEIVLLSCISAEIRVIALFQPPSCISDFRFILAALLIIPLKSLTWTHMGV